MSEVLLGRDLGRPAVRQLTLSLRPQVPALLCASSVLAVFSLGPVPSEVRLTSGWVLLLPAPSVLPRRPTGLKGQQKTQVANLGKTVHTTSHFPPEQVVPVFS